MAVPTENQIFNKFYRWGRDIGPIQTIKAQSAGPAPLYDFMSVNIISANKLYPFPCVLWEETGETNEYDKPVLREVHGEHWEWVVSLNLYSNQALDTAIKLTSSLDNGNIQLDYFKPIDIQKNSAIRRLPQMIEGKWEDRAQFDVTIAGTVTHGFIVDVVETVNIFLALRVDGTDLGVDTDFSVQRPTTP